MTQVVIRPGASGTRLAARCWGAVTAAVGLALVARPHAVAGLVSPDGVLPDLLVVRVLGSRQLVQGLSVVSQPDRRRLLQTGSVVDVLHAASMIGAARWRPRYRRAALASAAFAGMSALAGSLISRRP